MKLRRSVGGALLLLTACTENGSGHAPGSGRAISSHAALGTVPASEVATWTRVGPPAQGPDGRYLQAAAFDETRKVLVMFGGIPTDSTAVMALRDLWEWDSAAGTWTNRTPAGDKPNARGGASMVFDSVHNNLVIYGGRSLTGEEYVDYADVWEWDPKTGTFSDRSTSGQGPGYRAEQSMVFEKSTGKVLLFGGGTTDSRAFNGISVASGDTWEWDPALGKWTQLAPPSAPSARYASALIWDSKRNVAVLFGGMEKPQADLSGIPKQDTWEWDPATLNWTNRTIAGTVPSARYGHAMAYDPGRGVIVLVGGWDIGTGDALADVWEWDPTTGAWTQRLTGSEPNLPPARLYASLVTDSAQGHLDLVGGLPQVGNGQSTSGTNPLPGEIWELDPKSATFTNRTPPAPKAWPSPRSYPAMAFCPTSGKTYVFGGLDDNSALLDDLWEWDGSAWSQVVSAVRPTARMSAAMAYDPSRKSLILYGGANSTGYAPVQPVGSVIFGDTWEWKSDTRQWTQLHPTSSPEARDSHAMVTDSGRAKVLLFGGERSSYAYTYPIPGGPTSQDPMSNAVWEWDGSLTTWTNRTPSPLTVTPVGRLFPPLTFDQDRQKMVLIADESDDGSNGDNGSNGFFWEWDPVTAGWVLRDSGDAVDFESSGTALVAYDSLRRRHIVPIGGMAGATWTGSGWIAKIWELDGKGPTWYSRALSSGPDARLTQAVTAFDSQRGVIVLFGGVGSMANGASFASTSETWEYKVTNLGNGEGCTAAAASTCASGFCVDGVCCAVASCSGACQSCSVAGQEGTCARAAAGTEVSGSCAGGQACDGNGACQSKNGTTCSTASVCASGFCVDGVCCESACTDTCVSCNQAGRSGKCSAYTTGSDPENECGSGSDPCLMTCNGAGACDAPPSGTSCGTCQFCDGAGTCAPLDPSVCDTGGSGGPSTGGQRGSGGAGGIGGTVGAGGSSGTGGAMSNIDGGGDAMAPDAGSSDGGRDAMAPDVGTSDSGGDAIAPDVSSLDSGRDVATPDTSSPDSGRNAITSDASANIKLGHSGCDCDLGQTAPDAPGLPFVLLGAAFLWRRLCRRQAGRRSWMRCPIRPISTANQLALTGLAAGVLLLLATCSETNRGNGTRMESSHLALGTVPASEIATWTRADVPPPPTPAPRYLQSAAVDEARKVLVMFGGWNVSATAVQDLWEWDPATDKWTNRTSTGSKPNARAGASMVYDSIRKKFVIFGGRSSTGYDFADTWEWDPVGGAFTDRTSSGPGARSQHSMVFEKSTGKVLLFGGGLADSGSSIWPEYYHYGDPTVSDPGSLPSSEEPSPDASGISLAFGDTWEWDPTAGAWTKLTPATAPSARYDSALAWDSQRNRAVLFGGMQKDQAAADGIPQQDTWEWDPATPGWTLRQIAGSKPSARYGHAMAYDPSRGMTILVGGKDFQTHLGLADVWDWDSTKGAWAQRLTGNESNLPVARMYASLVADPAQSRLDLVAGVTLLGPYVASSPPYAGTQISPSGELWQLDPDTAVFTNRTPPQNTPSATSGFAMAFCPATGKTYVFGGSSGQSPFPLLDELWEWDGSSWSQIKSDVRPSAREYAAMAYDPVRKSLILYGGDNNLDANTGQVTVLEDTWEWNSSTRQWSQLFPTSSPGPEDSPAMVTDSGRGKVLLFDGIRDTSPYVVWEWDGATTTWTSRTPVPGTVTPGTNGWTTLDINGGLTFDDGRQKMFLFDGTPYWQGTSSNSVFWEWNPVSAGWTFRDTGDFIDFGSDFPVFAYDSLRRRQVATPVPKDPTGATTAVNTIELDTSGPTWYVRSLSTGPTSPGSGLMVFDSKRGVMVLVGAGTDNGEVWEYKVTNLGNGEGCTAATASNCASGFCVDGECCGSAACSGSCQSCAVAGHEGTCAMVVPGTEVPGSCPGQACGTGGSCNTKNGTACSSASACASGFCVDGVCCESACDGICVSCDQAGQAGKCSAYTAGSDPQKECGLGSGVCRSTCNGAGACDYPQYGTPCGTCKECDGTGACTVDVDPVACASDGTGGAGGFGGGTGGAVGTAAGGASGGGGANGGASVGGGGGAGSASSSGGAVAVGGAASGGAGGSGGSLSGGADGGSGTGGSAGRADGGRDSISPDMGKSDSRTDLLLPDDASVEGQRDASPPDASGRMRLVRGGCACSLGHDATAARPVPAFALLSAAFLLQRLRRKRGE